MILKKSKYPFLNLLLPILTMETIIYYWHQTVSSLRFKFLQSCTTHFLLPFLQKQQQKWNKQLNNTLAGKEGNQEFKNTYLLKTSKKVKNYITNFSFNNIKNKM